MKDDLYNRFLQLKKNRVQKSPKENLNEKKNLHEIFGPPRSGKEKNRYPQDAPLKNLVIPGWTKIEEFCYRRGWETAIPEGVLVPESPLVPDGFSYEDLIFIDSETTGLSGAGTVIFLMGVGRIKNDRFRIDQYFLSDYPGELEFLNCLHQELPRESLYVSYNGKAFDCSILKSRFLLNGLFHDFPNQLDLLHTVRRFWKTIMDSCSLASVEKELLSIVRELDVPGYLVPEYYFSFLKSGDPSPLQGVFQHHLQDIHSLLLLFGYISGIILRPETRGKIDEYQLGRYLTRRGLPGGIELLEELTYRGNLPAGFSAALYHKRMKLWKKALPLWEHLIQSHRHVISGIEAAKYWEHIAKKPEKALAIVEELLSWREGESYINSLSHRKNRLIRKISRQQEDPSLNH
jgi:uncharacterized protein